MLKIGNNIVRAVYKGSTKISVIYKGSTAIFPGVEYPIAGTEYASSWTYTNSYTRTRDAYPWSQQVYQDGSLGSKVYGTTYQDTETASTTTENSGLYWNGSCGSNYYYVDYQKVRAKYTFYDGVVNYGSYYNGDSRSQRIDGSCGWSRAWTGWTNTGSISDANGTVGQYSCDVNWSVNYYQQIRYYQYPDGSSRTGTEYMAGSEYSRVQTEGQCGYTAEQPRREWPYYGYNDYSPADAWWSCFDWPIGSIYQDLSSGLYYSESTGVNLAPPGFYVLQKGSDVNESIICEVW